MNAVTSNFSIALHACELQKGFEKLHDRPISRVREREYMDYALRHIRSYGAPDPMYSLYKFFLYFRIEEYIR